MEIKEIWSSTHIKQAGSLQYPDSYPINPQPNPAPELFLLFFKSKKKSESVPKQNATLQGKQQANLLCS